MIRRWSNRAVATGRTSRAETTTRGIGCFGCFGKMSFARRTLAWTVVEACRAELGSTGPVQAELLQAAAAAAAAAGTEAFPSPKPEDPNRPSRAASSRHASLHRCRLAGWICRSCDAYALLLRLRRHLPRRMQMRRRGPNWVDAAPHGSPPWRKWQQTIWIHCHYNMRRIPGRSGPAASFRLPLPPAGSCDGSHSHDDCCSAQNKSIPRGRCRPGRPWGAEPYLHRRQLQ